MPILGAHMSIAGGYHKAVRAAHAAGCDCVQLFTKNNNQWRAKELTDKDRAAFTAALTELGITHPISHNSYLINLGSPDDELWRKSIDAMVIELQRAEALGIVSVVAHPGAFTTSSEEAGVARIAAGLDEVHRQTPQAVSRVLLETTAGQGSNLGWRFEQLAAILDAVADPDRLGVCFDTCHVFAAGYAMETDKEYAATIRALDKAFGYKKIAAFHLNDSLKPFGSRKDRHAAIGSGEMGLEPFRHLLNDRRFKQVPMYLETPKGEEDGVDLDVVNLTTLRSLVG
ncbi:deoxyribonuclease IV [Botrimarina hoheduenensis]|uniref:Probable endonuclease 4 n=1 Tax=Botrimarina hoheduenensis TaxID=2528000 RepID=A0A5C5WCK7_9BACT|nr:deoxyribonuclease IV [Botrimarina hoheduenensis]TWT48404.1 Endonuclease 4 [Botrimarina hoheduenensis]